MELSEEFRTTVAHALQLPPIPSDVWWATDYHIAWLADALAVYGVKTWLIHGSL